MPAISSSERLLVALDVETDREALSLIKATRKSADLYKVGPALVLRYGPAIFKKIRAAGKKIFLDLKFHDIPNTMKNAIAALRGTGIYSATVHASAGRAALEGVSRLARRPRLWGVTVLTSLTSDDLSDLGVSGAAADQVSRLARLAQASVLDGVVASVRETATLRDLLGPRFTIVTPGIRLPGDAAADQKRIATPRAARAAGSTFIVVGRPLVEAKKPDQVAADILRDWTRSAGGRA